MADKNSTGLSPSEEVNPKSRSLEMIEEYGKTANNTAESNKEAAATNAAAIQEVINHKELLLAKASAAETSYDNMLKNRGNVLLKAGGRLVADITSYDTQIQGMIKSLSDLKKSFQTLKDDLAKADSSASTLEDLVRRKSSDDPIISLFDVNDFKLIEEVKKYGGYVEQGADDLNLALQNIPATEIKIDLSKMKKKATEIGKLTNALHKVLSDNLEFARVEVKRIKSDKRTAVTEKIEADHTLKKAETELSRVQKYWEENN